MSDTTIAIVRALFRRGPWPRTFDVAHLDRHGLGAHVYAEGLRQGVDVRALRQSWLTSAATRQPDVRHLLRGFDVIAWKGLDYAARLYADPAERPMGDHDLLVREADFDRALATLKQAGFVDALVQTGVAAHPRHYAAQLVRGAQHVDLHRSVRQAVRASVDYDAVFERAQGGFLEAIDRVLFHAAHMAGHELSVPLIAYVDLERLLAETPLSPEMLERAKVYGLLRPLRAVLDMRAALFGWPSRRKAHARDVSAMKRPVRLVQLVRKAALFDSVGALARFGVYALNRARGAAGPAQSR